MESAECLAPWLEILIISIMELFTVFLALWDECVSIPLSIVSGKCQRQSKVSVFLYLSQTRQSLKLSVFQSDFSYRFVRLVAQLEKSRRFSLKSMTKQRALVLRIKILSEV